MSLALVELQAALEALAPPHLAGSWDNVGLLIDPRAPGDELEVERVLLTIDATPAVLEEATREGVQCLVAYHPPLFQPLRRLSYAGSPAAVAALRAGFAVYSPHSALDAAPGGLNDWLAEAFGAGDVQPIVSAAEIAPGAAYKVVVFVPGEHADALREALSAAGAGIIGHYDQCSFGLDGQGTFLGRQGAHPVVGQMGQLERVAELRLEMVCSEQALPGVARAIAERHPYEEPAWDVYALAPKPRIAAGDGRVVHLAAPLPLAELVARLKGHLGVEHLRLATAERHAGGAPVRTIALCAGAGGAVLERARGADLLVTGELGHHHVLRHLREQKSVLLSEHSSSERGYLPRYRERLLEATDGRVEIQVAQSDREPLRIV